MRTLIHTLYYTLLLGVFLTACSTQKNLKEANFDVLFNGKNLDGWVGNKQSYRAENGAIVVDPKGKGGGNLYTQKEYSNFNFRFELFCLWYYSRQTRFFKANWGMELTRSNCPRFKNQNY